jgi:hypothetical protein
VKNALAYYSNWGERKYFMRLFAGWHKQVASNLI